MSTTGPTPPTAMAASPLPNNAPTQTLPSMRDLDGLETDLNRIDTTLAELDGTDDQSAAGA